jgi:hypothetical protein
MKNEAATILIALLMPGVLITAFPARYVHSAAVAATPKPVPVPAPRPADMPGREPPSQERNAHVPPETSRPPGPAIDQTCLDRLATAGVEVEPAPPPAATRNECVIDTPVRVNAVRVASRPEVLIRLPERPTLSCHFVEQLGHWLGDLVDPLVAGRTGADIKAVRTGPGYECRNRNRSQDGKLSAHATGIALDIMSFQLTNGSTIPVKPNGNDRDLATMNVLRAAACGWFTTVLGPGSDAAHADHMHIDVLPHGSSNNYRICQ